MQRGNRFTDICGRGKSSFFFFLVSAAAASRRRVYYANVCCLFFFLSFFRFPPQSRNDASPCKIERRNQTPEVDAAATAARMSGLSHARGSNRVYIRWCKLAISPVLLAETRLLPRQLNPLPPPPPWCPLAPISIQRRSGTIRDGSSKFRDAPLTYNILRRGHFHSFRITLVYFNYRRPEKMYEFLPTPLPSISGKTYLHWFA